MAFFIINILSKSRGRLKYGLEHPDGKFFKGELESRLNGHIGFDYEIYSIDAINEDEYNIQKDNFSPLSN